MNTEVRIPSLFALCIGAIKDVILDESGNIHYVYKLPSELLHQLISILPPLALQNLQDAMPLVSSDDCWFSYDCSGDSRKRRRIENFDIAWKALCKSRGSAVQTFSVDLLPKDVHQDESTINWQQIFWEKHLQDCLNVITETISSTSFDGFLGDVEIPDALVRYISDERFVRRSRSHLKLADHCERFGPYARCLTLQSVHCVAEIGNLLRKCQLEYLTVLWLKSKEQVEGLCKLLEQNKQTLSSVEFLHCKLPANLVTAICQSLLAKGYEKIIIKSLSFKGSSFLDSSRIPLPLGLESLLSISSGLTSLVLSNNHIWWKTAKMVFDTLVEAESTLQVLDLSENNITGWLSHYKWGFRSSINPDQQIIKSLKSLRMLNLRSNNLQKDDADCLKYALVYMPNLEVLNLSENPLENEGIRNLIPYFDKKSKSDTPLAELFLENCMLTIHGAVPLLRELGASKVPLKSLSIGDNHLSSEFGAALGRFICSGIQALNVKGIDLGLSGFSDAEQNINQELSLVSIDISGNGGGVRTANFLSKLISKAPKLTTVNASKNWIPHDSVPAICSFLKAGKGKLEHLDMSYNPLCNKPDIASQLAEFQINGKPSILLSSTHAFLYDSDP